MTQEWHSGGYYISTDKSRLDLAVIHNFLTTSYWAAGIPIETVKKSLEHSLNFGVYEEGKQVGFARVITDDTRNRGKGCRRYSRRIVRERGACDHGRSNQGGGGAQEKEPRADCRIAGVGCRGYRSGTRFFLAGKEQWCSPHTMI